MNAEEIIWKWFLKTCSSLTLSESSTFHVRGNYIHRIKNNPLEYRDGEVFLDLPVVKYGKKTNTIARELTEHWFYTLCSYKFDALKRALKQSGFDLINNFERGQIKSGKLFCTYDDILFKITPSKESSPVVTTDKSENMKIEMLEPDALKRFEIIAEYGICECDLCRSLKKDRSKRFLIDKVKSHDAKENLKAAMYYNRDEEEKKRSKELGTKTYIYDDEHNENIYGLYSKAIDKEENPYLYAARSLYTMDNYEYTSDDSLEDINVAIEKKSETPLFYYLRAKNDSFSHFDDPDDKIEDLTFAIDNYDGQGFDLYDAIDERASTYKYDDNHQKAIEDYLLLCENRSNQEYYLGELAKLYLKVNDFDKAFETINTLSKNRLNNIPYLVDIWEKGVKKIKSLKKYKEVKAAKEELLLDVKGSINHINSCYHNIAIKKAQHGAYESFAEYLYSIGLYQESIDICNYFLYDSELAYGAMFENRIKAIIVSAEEKIG